MEFGVDVNNYYFLFYLFRVFSLHGRHVAPGKALASEKMRRKGGGGVEPPRVYNCIVVMEHAGRQQ